MENFEKLGVFYLGKDYDLPQKRVEDNPILLKSKDLTTHAIIIGMTGSGKTGLGISLMEEAILDNIPIIAIDPKGDLSNLACVFPSFDADDFKPFVSVSDAESKSISLDDFARDQALLWKQGLVDWGQDENRLLTLKEKSNIRIYTPGSQSGIPVSILKSFQAPNLAILEDKEAFEDRLSATTQGLLSLINLDLDPFSSREFVLISNLIQNAWKQSISITLEALISSIQKPPFEKIGVMDIEHFYPAKERFELAMMLNNLIASVGFEAWTQGVELNIDQFLYDEAARPQVSIFSIAHLSDQERSFFVTMLLNELLAWTRTQSGSSSLRALFYMDELYGFLPPSANPPTKKPLLTLLKQARACGLGLVLSTQNPVDLDYKALSNAGTWFIGRLQTERDKERVMAGLEGASSSTDFKKSEIEKILAGLSKRVFYLHSVHEDGARIFQTRWTLSYLAGPLNKQQIALLNQNKVQRHTQATVHHQIKQESIELQSLPILDASIKQVFFPSKNGKNSFQAKLIGITDVVYDQDKLKLSETVQYTFLTDVSDGPIPVDWKKDAPITMNSSDLLSTAPQDARYQSVPKALLDSQNYKKWENLLSQTIRTSIPLKLFHQSKLQFVSHYNETERDFKIRLQQYIHELRDEAMDDLKEKYAAKLQALENRLLSSQQMVEKQNTLASQKKMDAMVSAGSALLGAFLGTKKISATSVSKMGTALRRGSSALKSSQGIEQASEKLQSIQTQKDELLLDIEEKLTELSREFDAYLDQIEEISINALASNITIHFVGLAWVEID